MNQFKKIFVFSTLLLEAGWAYSSTPQPAPAFNLQPIQSLISSANSDISAFMAWNEPAEGQAAVDSLVQLIQGLYQIINLENPALGKALALLDPVFSQGATYITAQNLNISTNPLPSATIPQPVYNSMNSPLGTTFVTTYPLTSIATNIVETSAKMTTVSNWTNQLNLLTQNQLNTGIYFVMNINQTTNIISCYVFESDKQTQIGQTFTTPLTCAPNELTITYNSQTTTLSSNLPATFAIFVTSNYAKTLPSSVISSMNSPTTITVNVPFLQAKTQVQQTAQNNPVLDMGPFNLSSPLNTISSANWMSGVYITMFINTINSSVVYDIWASDKATHLGSMSQPLSILTGITSSTFSFEQSFEGAVQTTTISPTKALLIKGAQSPSSLYNNNLNNAITFSIPKTDLEHLQLTFTSSTYTPESFNVYSANGISEQILQNTNVDLSAGVYIIPAVPNLGACNLLTLVFFDNNKNFLGIQNASGPSCVNPNLTGYTANVPSGPTSAAIPMSGCLLLQLTS